MNLLLYSTVYIVKLLKYYVNSNRIYEIETNFQKLLWVKKYAEHEFRIYKFII